MNLRAFAPTLLAAMLVAAPAVAQQVPHSDLDGRFDAFLQAEHVPGLVHGVVQDGRLVHVRATGVADLDAGRPVDPDTAFRIASMSKAFVALAVLALRDDGRLSLDDPVARLVRGFRDPATTKDSPPITVRDLLAHAAGFVTDDPWGDRQLETAPAAFDRLIRAGWPGATPPRTRFEYSNLGYTLLGRVVTSVSGRPYQRFVTERLLAPLGMAATTYDVRLVPAARRAQGYRWESGRWTPEPILGDGEFGAMGGLWTTARDYARWVAFLLSAWPPRDDADTGPVRRATVRELAFANGVPQAQQMTGADGAPCTVAQAYSYGMIVGSGCGIGRYVQHSGGLPGYGSNVLLLPEAGVGLFVLANRTYAPTFRANLPAAAALVRDGLAAARAVPPSPELRRVAEGAAAAYDAGRIERMGPLLAGNVLLDRSASERNADLAALRLRHGGCRLSAVAATHRLRGTFTLQCERGRIAGLLLLAPTPYPQAQTVEFGSP